MSRIFKLILAVSIAASFTMVAGGAYAAEMDGSPKISGDAGFGFGQRTDSGFDGNSAADDIEGWTGSWESNLIASGDNGKVFYKYRIRLRGVDGPRAAGLPSNTLNDNEPQTVRGLVGWRTTDAFTITIRKWATSPVASVAENDPVQNIAYAYTGDMADKLQIDFAFKAGIGTFGATIAPKTPSKQSTTGSAGSGASGDTENSNMEFYAKLKFGCIGLNVKLNQASGTGYDDRATTTSDDTSVCTLSQYECTATVDTANANYGKKATQSYDSSGMQIHAKIPLGPANLGVDYETNASDIDDAAGVGAAGSKEYTVDYIGLKVSVAGIVAGFATHAEESTFTGGTSGYTATYLSVHYRIPQGKGAWTGPEYSSRTIADDTPGSTAADEETTTIRWLQVIKF